MPLVPPAPFAHPWEARVESEAEALVEGLVPAAAAVEVVAEVPAGASMACAGSMEVWAGDAPLPTDGSFH